MIANIAYFLAGIATGAGALVLALWLSIRLDNATDAAMNDRRRDAMGAVERGGKVRGW